MKRKNSFWFKAGLVSLALSATLVAGCKGSSGEASQGKLKVATVDLLRVMESRPETRSIRLEWSNQAGDTYLQLAEASDPAEAELLRQKIAQRSEAWQARVDEFMEESISLVEAQAKGLAEERGVDMVIVDNPLTKTIKYREGEDFTTDVLLRLQTSESQ